MLILPAAAVLVLIVLIVRVRLHAFPALMIVSLGLGLAAGLPPTEVARAFQEGVGGTLGFVAIVIGLGTFAGALLAESGGARVVAHAATRAIGPARLPWAIALVGFVVGLPIFFSVGLVLLFPVVAGLAAATSRPLAALALPLVAGLSASHGLVAPHPGPLVAIDRLGADTGLSIVYGILAGIPATIIAGPIFARRVLPHVSLPFTSDAARREPQPDAAAPPGVAATLATVLLPVALMLAATVAEPRLAGPAGAWIAFIGNPAVALLIGTLAASWVFGYARGLGGARLLAIAEASLLPIASVLVIDLVV
jgi:GntP family gluconate:H+ symporter